MDGLCQHPRDWRGFNTMNTDEKILEVLNAILEKQSAILEVVLAIQRDTTQVSFDLQSGLPL